MWKNEYREAMHPYLIQGLPYPEGVVRYGDKLNKETAEHLFPEYAELKYRP